MTDVEKVDIDAALKHLGFDSVADLHYWAVDNSELNRFDALCELLARHRQYGYDQGYYDGRQYDGAEERAKIVAWLRETIFNCTLADIPSAIEAKEHLDDRYQQGD